MLALVVDDSRTVRLVIRSILADLGIDTVEAGNGQEALLRLAEFPEIGLALVDWNMPVMDGLEFVVAVRAQRGLDGLRLVMVTTETESEQMLRAMAAGANEYVMKPFTKEVLVAKLSLLDAFGD